jgi:hypothetical protein
VKFPVDFTLYLSALTKVAAKLECENTSNDQRHGNGADDETTGRDSESDGEEDRLDGGS